MDDLVVLRLSEGDLHIRVTTKDAFLADFKRDFEGCRPPEFASTEEDIRKINLNQFEGYVLIEGKIITPRAKQVVTDWDL